MTDVQTRLRQATLALSLLLGLSALGLMVVAGAFGSWFVLGFEAVLIATAVIGLLFGRGRFPEAPAMTLTLLAGAVGLCSALGYLSTGASGYALGPVPMKLVLAARLALAGLFGLGACAAALGTRPAAWGRVALGTILVLAPTAAAGIAFSSLGAPVVQAIGGMGRAVAVGVAAIGFLVWVGLVSAGGHMIITSFERALPAPWQKSGNSPDAA